MFACSVGDPRIPVLGFPDLVGDFDIGFAVVDVFPLIFGFVYWVDLE